MGFDVIGIGSPLVDVLVKTKSKLVADMKIKKGGMYLYDDTSELYKKIKVSIVKTTPGDSTANTIVGIASLGGYTGYIGKVGDDENGKLFEESLREKEVVPRLAKSKIPTGTVIALITEDKERTMIVSLGASRELLAEDIDEEDIKGSKILHLTGYQLEEPNLKKASMYALEIAKANKVMVSIDLADFNLVKRNLDFLKDVAGEYADIIFANETEAKAFTGKEPEKALEKISEMCEIAVVKVGSKGSFIKKDNIVTNVPSYKVDTVDTTGAGDMYAAGVLYGISKNYDMLRCGKVGAFAASKIVERYGARLDISIKDDILNL